MRKRFAIVTISVFLVLFIGCHINKDDYTTIPIEHRSFLLDWEKDLITTDGREPITEDVQLTGEWCKYGDNSIKGIYNQRSAPKIQRASWYIYDCPERITNWSFATWLYYTENLSTYNIRVFHVEWVSSAGKGIKIYCRSYDGVLFGSYEIFKDWKSIDTGRINIATGNQLKGEHYIGFQFEPFDNKVTFIFDNALFNLQTIEMEYDRLNGSWDNIHIYSIVDAEDRDVALYYDDTYFAYESLLTIKDLQNHYETDTSWNQEE